MIRFLRAWLLASLCVATPWVPLRGQSPSEIAAGVEIRRTDYGVPHVLAPDLRGAGFGLAYAEAEDHGERVVLGLIRARGQLARMSGLTEDLRSDFWYARGHRRAQETYDLLTPELREFMEGFALGLNHYFALHPDEAPEGALLDFTGIDVHAMSIGQYSPAIVRRFLDRAESGSGARPDPLTPEDGSNAWALAPSRTVSGQAILVRNPHLSWSAGYYEAHLRVPGVLDFYGDFRIGGLFGIIAGFNGDLGWTTTNNAPDLDEIYELRLDPERPDHYRLDGGSHALGTTELEVEVRNRGPSGGSRTERRTFFHTSLGPVIHRNGRSVFVIRSTPDLEYRRGEQLLAMMRATNFEGWRSAMRMQAISASNYTYADRAGNIFYVWNAMLPDLPHEPREDDAVPIRRSAEAWNRLVPFDSLPQVLNPEGGYVQNANDPPHFTNLNQPLDPELLPENVPGPRLRLRSQLSATLLHGEERRSLEDVIELKHSPRMLLADRVKDDLVSLVRVSDAGDRAREAAAVLAAWDNTVAVDSRGGVLFKLWAQRYLESVDSTGWFKEPWTPERPVDTPRGLGSGPEGIRALEWAAAEAERRFGRMDVPWGAAHRVRHGEVDLPASGCVGALGCFRVLGYEDARDGRWVANRGDGWILAVEFGDQPRAYSVLAYGQSSRPESPHFGDQAALFARGDLKPVAFAERDIARSLIRVYRPGGEIRR